MTPSRWIGPAVLVAVAALVAPSAGYAADPKAPKKPAAAKPTPDAAAKPDEAPKPDDASAKPLPPPGQAQELTAEDEAKAMRFLAEGNKAFKTGKFPQAEEAYRKAYELKPVHDIAGNLAMAEFALNKPRDAAEHLAFAIRLFPITGDKLVRDAMVKTFEQCRQQVATVKVSTNVKGTLVYVDGRLMGESPLPDDVFVEEGNHTVEGKATGYKPFSKPFTSTKGGEVSVSLTLVALPQSSRQVFIEVPAQRRSVVPGVVLGAGALLAAGAGVGVYFLADAKKNSLIQDGTQYPKGACLVPSPPGYCADLKNRAYAVDTFRTVSVGAFIGAGVLALGAVTYLVWPNARPKTPTRGSLQVSPLLGAGTNGMVVSGSF